MNIMNKIKIATLFLLGTLSLGLASCSDDDDDLTPSNADVNGFAPAASDNSQTAQIRNDFFKATGAYLLFNDTLLTTSTNGQPELFDANYSITSSPAVSTGLDDNDYKYVYITDVAQQQKAADTIKEYLVKKLGKQLPFSFFLVDDIYYSYTTWSGNVKKKHLPMLIAPRGYVISTQEGALYDDPETVVSSLLADLVTARVNKADAAITEKFYSYSKDYYDKDFSDLNLNVDDFNNDPTLIWNYGFFNYGDFYGGFFYNKGQDIKDWVKAVFSTDRATFAETYGSSAVMMSKYDAMKEIIHNMGFNI